MSVATSAAQGAGEIEGLRVVEMGLDGGWRTFSGDFIHKERTRCWSGILQDGNIGEIPSAEDSEAEL